ncbi:MAG: diacylglycerol kinase family lipid kinase [Dehalococcoidia bacterium]|nr:diacylglycerol kinase family lipid kinase [Dehalococcoidia bacterium]
MAKQYAKVIINPVAGGNKNTYRRWPYIENLLRRGGLSYDFQYTEGRGHALELSRLAAKEGYSFLIAVGGDGTIHEVANGLLSSSCAVLPALGIIATGTGNDFIRSMGIPKDCAQSCRKVIEARRRLIDAGQVEYTDKSGKRAMSYFINGAGVGFDAEVADGSKRVPRFMGNTVPFVFSLLKLLPFYRNKDVRINIDGRDEKKRVLSVVVTNGAYFGGGMRIAPQAVLDDRHLDVVTIGDVRKAELLQVFPRVYDGTHVIHPKVCLEKADCVSIECDRRILLQADGELLGSGPVTFKVMPAALVVVA